MNRGYSRCHSGPRVRPIWTLVLLSFSSTGAHAADQGQSLAAVQFNDIFLQQFGPSPIDASRFAKGNVAAPGDYRADLYVNEVWLGRAEVTLKKAEGDSTVPCFNRDLLERIGVDFTKLSAEASTLLDKGKDTCAPLPVLINDAVASFDNGEQRLDVSVPQVALSRQPRGYVDPRYWDEGVPAALLQYNANVYHSVSGGMAATQGYVGLTAGVNFGPWRFRHNGSLTTSTLGGDHYQDIQTTLQRSIAPLKSQLLLGDGFTDGAMFDSVGFRGVQLATDDRMYPESQRGYAPTIRGTARSNALVQVLQNGNVLYETTVAAGPFEINDLYPTGYGGNLQVVVTEADGTKTTSLVPYAAAVNALRPGITRFNLTAGQFRDAQISTTPLLFQGTVQHGYTNTITGYGGVTAAEGYVAAVIGAALNTKIGAFGLDVTQSNANLQGQASRSGQSVRLSYTERVAPTDTNISVAAYRYSSSGFLSLRDAMMIRAGNVNMNGYGNGVQRSSLQVTVNQNLPQGYGAFYLSGSTQDYWNRAGTDTQFQAGYNNNFKRINYGVSLSRQYDLTTQKWDNRVMLTLGIPLGTGSHAPYSTSSVQQDSNGGTTLQEAVTGTMGVDNAFTYGLNAGYSGGGQSGDTANFGSNASYRSPVATFTGNVGASSGYTQAGAGVSGGIVAYSGGVAFTPTMGETMAIVEAKDAAGARITAGSGLRIDPWGHALVSNLTPFSNNEIEIDPKGLPVSVELKSTSQRVAPTAGAVVRVAFETDNPGAAAIIRGTTAEGKPLPYGADVLDESGNVVGTVAQGGRAVVRGLKMTTGELTVKWGDAADYQCKLSYSLPTTMSSKATTWTTLDSTCRNK